MASELSFSYNVLDQSESVIKPVKPSEFCSGNYDQPDLIVAYALYVDESFLGKKSREILSRSLAEDKMMLRSNQKWHNLRTIKDLDGDANGIDVASYVEKYRKAVFSFSSNLNPEVFVKIDSKGCAYLNGFFELSRDVVFTVKNNALSDSIFRTSRFIKAVAAFGSKRVYLGNNIGAYYKFSLLNPFAYQTIENIIAAMRLLKEDTTDQTLLSRLRRSVFFDSVQSAFKRYVYLGDCSYRVNLNRHDSMLTAFPVDKLSSIEEIKPIRLFEKTAAFIRNLLKSQGDANPLYVSVCIIGHTEASRCGDESGLMDYASSVLNWYSRLWNSQAEGVEKTHKPRLCLNIRNLVSAADWPPENRESSRKSFTCSVQTKKKEQHKELAICHQATCTISMVDYESEFRYSTKRLQSEIVNNDLVFLLDCPWLSTENYELKQRGSLDSFCYELGYQQRNAPLEPQKERARFISDSHGFFKYSAFREMDSQYNRIMASTTTKSGEIVRIMRDSMIKRIYSIYSSQRSERLVEKGHARSKEMYIFTSEREGVEHSFLATYPLTRKEKYDGRSHTIIQFSNHMSAPLENSQNGQVTFHISLWSVLKYVSVSFAYLEFKRKLEEKLNGSHELFNPNSSINYMELCRNILICFNVTNCLRHVAISVVFRDGIEECIDAVEGVSDRSEFKKNLKKLIWEFIKPFYGQCVFQSNAHYGDDAIKTAFSMNLYSSANDVETMLFYHRYCTICRNDRFYFIDVDFEEELADGVVHLKESEFLDRDFFRDKKLYDNMLETLEQSTDITLGMRSMLSDSNELFGMPSMYNHIINQLVSACEATGYTETNVYKNALKLQKED